MKHAINAGSLHNDNLAPGAADSEPSPRWLADRAARIASLIPKWASRRGGARAGTICACAEAVKILLMPLTPCVGKTVVASGAAFGC